MPLVQHGRMGGRGSRHIGIDGLRGYAAFVVAIYHTVLGLDPSQIQRILSPTIQSLNDSYAIATKMVADHGQR